MLNKAATTDSHDSHRPVVIGDILLHTESKITIIPVIIQPSTSPSSSSLSVDKSSIQRLSPNSSGTNNTQTIVQCDLKNNSSMKDSNERIKSSSSSKKILRMHKAGLALVKELKSKVIITNHNEQKTLTTDNEQRTHL